MSMHIDARPGDFAERVILPGDPLRAKYIAENYLEKPVLINDVRNMLGYTGYYKDQRISVFPTGMGAPTAYLYVTELCRDYGCKVIVRPGTCGAYREAIQLGDLIFAQAVSPTGDLLEHVVPGHFSPIADFNLVRRAVEECEKKGVNFKVGNIFSSDIFYDESNSGMEWAKMGVLGVEMESAALYCNAARAGKKALCICTVSDSFIYPEENTTAEERQNSFTKMMELALELA